jgi:hypothetical protein
MFRIIDDPRLVDDVVSSMSHLRTAIPHDHLQDTQVKELLDCLSGDFVCEEELEQRIDRVESDGAFDPSNPNNMLYGGALQMGGISADITWKSVKAYYFAYFHRRSS